jgi:hypothetical protein
MDSAISPQVCCTTATATANQWISELTAFGSPVRLLMTTAILLHGVLLVAFGLGIWRFAYRRSLRRVAVLLIVAGVIGFPTHTAFAMSSRSMTAGFNDSMHAILVARIRSHRVRGGGTIRCRISLAGFDSIRSSQFSSSSGSGLRRQSPFKGSTELDAMGRSIREH